MSTPATTSDPSAATLWRAARAPVAVALIVVLGALLLVAIRAEQTPGRLDPRATEPAGSRALAQLLGREGVDVARAETTDAAVARVDAARAAGSGATVLITEPGLLVGEQLDRLAATGADVVLLDPGDEPLAALAPALSVAGHVLDDAREPACRLPAAERAGTLALRGSAYTARAVDGGEAFLCYATENAAPLAQVRTPARTVTALGDPGVLTNRRLDEDGNAALAMNLLGAHPTLVWWLPSLSDVPASAADASFYSLLPDGVGYGLVMLLIAVALIALWRMRRLGPVVPEPLPVVVRAAETVEGRARLYRRARARERAAESLRAATLGRLRPLAGLARHPDPNTVVTALGAHSGREPGEIGAVLYGAPPRDEAELIRLAEELDALEREVRRS